MANKFNLLVVFLLLNSSLIFAKKLPPINKQANTAFIQNEAGGFGSNPTKTPVKPNVEPMKPLNVPIQSPTLNTASNIPTPSPKKPYQQPVLQPSKAQTPNMSGKGASTPGPGSVQQLITYYDSHGKASHIRPYSYSDAVNKG